MNLKTVKISYYITTGLLTLLMLFSASMYLFTHEMAQQAFTSLGFPVYIIYPLAIAKILGLIAIWTNLSPRLKEWAYAGFAFDTMLAVVAHLSANDGQFAGALVGLLLVLASSFFYGKIEDENK